MADFFGTDGIRGEWGKNLTCSLGFSVGNALSQVKSTPRVLIGTDTRLSAHPIMLSVCAGIVQGGGNAICVGLAPTAAISYLTESGHYDYGVIITASHNPPSYNGIKVFDHTGRKLSDTDEEFLEEFFKQQSIALRPGKFVFSPQLLQKYFLHLKGSVSCNFSNLSVCLDASNGAASKIAPKVFKSLGARVFKVACGGNGEKINTNCGCLHIENLQHQMQKNGAQIGFAFDGDADRVIAVDKTGAVFDGDKLLYILAKQMKADGTLFANSVVGTSHTNSGIMVGLNRNKINLIRTDIGDKYVIEAMEKMNLTLGGEQSGHIIIKTHARTGDGILTALKICEIVQKTGKSLPELFDAQLIAQCNINLPVKDKIKILNNEGLKTLSNQIANSIAPAGRVLIRASGTEEKVRIMVEHPNFSTAQTLAAQIEDFIRKI